jgi:hypothetical protein
MIHPNPVPSSGGPIRLIAPEPPNRGYYKSLALDVASVLSALALGYSFYAHLVSGFSFWFSFFAFLLFAALSALQVFLQKKANRRTLVILGETLAFGVWFAYVNPQLLALALAVMFVLLLWGYIRSRSELAYTTEIRFFRATRHAASKAATAVLVAMILFYLAIMGTGNAGTGNGGLFVSEATFQPFYDWAATTINNIYPGIFLGGSFNTFAQSVVQQDLQNNPDYQKLKPAQQASTTVSATNDFTQSFARRLGIPITSSTMTSDVFYGSIVATMNSARDKLQTWFFVGWAIVVFLILRSIGIVVVWIAQLLALILYEILLASGFMKIVEHPDVKEEVEY